MPKARRSRVAIGYARASSEESKEFALSIEAQTEAMHAYATLRALHLETIFVDENTPGGTPIEARPGGAELVARLQGPHTGLAVLVLRLDRLFSSAAECIEYCDAFAAQETVLHVLDLEGAVVTTCSPVGTLMISVLRAARDMEQEQTRHQGKTILQARKARRGAKPLLGERIVRGYIVPDPAEMQAVKRISEMASSGKSLRLMAEALDHEGVPTKRRAKAWSKEAIRLIMKRIEKGEVRDLRAPDPAPSDIVS